MCDRFEMVWVYARWLLAQMIELKTRWDRPSLLLIDHTMSQQGRAANSDAAMPVLITGLSEPDPTRRFVTTIFDRPALRPEIALSHETTAMSQNESHGFSCDVTQLAIGHRGDGSWSAAAALTEARRIWRRQIAQLSPIVTNRGVYIS